MSTTITSQPTPMHFAYSDSYVEETSGSVGLLAELAALPEVYVKHILLPKDPNETVFLPSEYHVISTAGHMIYQGREENNRKRGVFSLFNIPFINTSGTEVMRMEEVSTSCKCQGQGLPAVLLSSQGQHMAQVTRRGGGCCPDVELVCEDDLERESPYSITVMSGGVSLTGPEYDINENGTAAGKVHADKYEPLYKRDYLVNYKITFPTSIRDVRHKAALIGSVIRMDVDKFCPPTKRYRGRLEPIVLFGNSSVSPS